MSGYTSKKSDVGIVTHAYSELGDKAEGRKEAVRMRAAPNLRDADNPTTPLMGGDSIILLCAHRDYRRDNVVNVLAVVVGKRALRARGPHQVSGRQENLLLQIRS